MARFLAAAFTLAILSGPVMSAGIALGGVTSASVTAIIDPDVADVGRPVNVWMGAVFRGVLYVRDGEAWVPYSRGAFPAAIGGLPLSASTPLTVVSQLDISAYPGLDLYVGYGASEQEMFSSPGRLVKIYSVPNAAAPPAANVVPMTVDSGPSSLALGRVNVPFVAVTVCAPGNSNDCRTIDYVVVDTGSSGLRVMSSAVSPAPALSTQRDSQGNPYAECMRFADGSYVWGPVKIADVRIGGELATSVPIQIVGDPAFASVPRGCSGTPSNSVQSFGANGILGVGHFREDCGSLCVRNSRNGLYYSCSAAGCTGATIAQAQQVANPVARFAKDNNGVVLQLPAVPAAGASSVVGSLVFGIGTRANNVLGGARVLPVDPSYGILTTMYRNIPYMNSFIDSGSTALFLPSGVGLPSCSRRDFIAAGFLCPTSTQDLSATIQGTNGTNATATFSVGNATALLSNPQLFAFGNLAAPNSDPLSFDWGLPFFFGRSVFTAIENASTPGGIGPYVAY